MENVRYFSRNFTYRTATFAREGKNPAENTYVLTKHWLAGWLAGWLAHTSIKKYTFLKGEGAHETKYIKKRNLDLGALLSAGSECGELYLSLFQLMHVGD